MPFWGKLLGLLFGFMFLKLPGAALGLILGHLFDRGYNQNFAQLGGFGRFFTSNADFQNNAIFLHSVFSLLGHMAKADGRVTEADIALANQLMNDMRLSSDAKKEAQSSFREGKAEDFPIATVLADLYTACQGRHDLLQIFLEILIQASLADGYLAKPEKTVLEKAAKYLKFTQAELHYLINAHRAQQRFRRADKTQSTPSRDTVETQLSDAFQILGVDQKASEKDVKRAYKKRMAEHHPDKLAAKGLPPEAMDLAKQKTQAIQAAYTIIKQEKNW